MTIYRRIVVCLASDEISALYEIAERKRRDPRAQAAMIIHHYLEKAGMLPARVIATKTQDATTDAQGRDSANLLDHANVVNHSEPIPYWTEESSTQEPVRKG